MTLKYICDIEQFAFAAKGPDLAHQWPTTPISQHVHTFSQTLSLSLPLSSLQNVHTFTTISQHVHTFTFPIIITSAYRQYAHFHFPNFQHLHFHFELSSSSQCVHCVYTHSLSPQPLFFSTSSHFLIQTLSLSSALSTSPNFLPFLKIVLLFYHFHFSHTFPKSSYLAFYQYVCCLYCHHQHILLLQYVFPRIFLRSINTLSPASADEYQKIAPPYFLHLIRKTEFQRTRKQRSLHLNLINQLYLHELKVITICISRNMNMKHELKTSPANTIGQNWISLDIQLAC